MSDAVVTFCAVVRARSAENGRAMQAFGPPGRVISPAFSILRQELDSMVRVIYLLSIRNPTERHRLVVATLGGERWTIATPKGKFRQVTDSEMVELAQNLQGWTQSVYKFGCAFVHLSDFHNHLAENPFEKLPHEERQAILQHMRYYHFGPASDEPTMAELAMYVPAVFEKIASNLEGYVKSLENDGGLDN